MSVASGPNVVASGLVFEYDMANTQRSWMGQPTTNQYGNATNYSGLGSIWFLLDNTTNSIQIATTGWCVVFNATLLASTPYSLSFQYMSDLSGSTLVIDNDGVDDNTWNTTITASGTWQTYTFTRTNVTAGAMGMYFAKNSGGNIYIKNIQIESNSFATPFVKGTRLATQSLLDLTQNNTLTATSLTYASDNTFSFNGSSNYITSSYNSIINSATTFTLDFWATLPNPASDMMIFSTSNYPTPTGWHLQTYQSRIILQVYPSGAWTLSTQTLPTNTVFCGTLVYNSGAIAYYHNGATAGTASYTFNPSTIGATIGAWINSGTPQYFVAGKIYNTKFYNRALSAAEVAQNFEALRSRYGI